MSFKREGNDANYLQTLRKRRINELLSEDIPEDEAKLLCNGRFACTVCPSNPVFDTVSVLGVHRQGKKHASYLDVHVAKKRELKQLIAARKHEQYLKDGTTSIKVAVPVERGLVTSCPYDPRVKKIKVQKGQRRPILEIGTNWGTASTQYSSHRESLTSAVVTGVNSGTGGSSALKETYEQSLCGPIMHGHQLKNIFSDKLEEPTRITPYQSKFRRNQPSVLQSKGSTSLAKELPFMTVLQNNALTNRLHTGVLTSPGPCSVSSSVVDLSSRKTLNLNVASGAVVSANKSSTPEHVSSSVANPSPQAGIQSHNFLSATSLFLPPPPPPPSSPSPPPPPSSFTSANNCSRMSSITSVTAASVTSLPVEDNKGLKERNSVSEKLRQLQGSGWKRDWDGKWIKDENAEFDSDEEAPDIP